MTRTKIGPLFLSYQINRDYNYPFGLAKGNNARARATVMATAIQDEFGKIHSIIVKLATTCRVYGSLCKWTKYRRKTIKSFDGCSRLKVNEIFVTAPQRKIVTCRRYEHMWKMKISIYSTRMYRAEERGQYLKILPCNNNPPSHPPRQGVEEFGRNHYVEWNQSIMAS